MGMLAEKSAASFLAGIGLQIQSLESKLTALNSATYDEHALARAPLACFLGLCLCYAPLACAFACATWSFIIDYCPPPRLRRIATRATGSAYNSDAQRLD